MSELQSIKLPAERYMSPFERQMRGGTHTSEVQAWVMTTYLSLTQIITKQNYSPIDPPNPDWWGAVLPLPAGIALNPDLYTRKLNTLKDRFRADGWNYVSTVVRNESAGLFLYALLDPVRVYPTGGNPFAPEIEPHGPIREAVQRIAQVGAWAPQVDGSTRYYPPHAITRIDIGILPAPEPAND